MKHTLTWFIMSFALVIGCESESDKAIREAQHDRDAEKCFQEAEVHYKAKRYTEVIAACKKAIDIHSDKAEAYYRAGGFYGMIGEDSEALAAYKKCVEIKPTGVFARGAMDNIRQIQDKK